MLLLIIAALFATSEQPLRPAFRSATLARDVGGFALGMPIAEARKVAPLTPIGNGEFEAEMDGITYRLAVTVLGRIYRVTSSQGLSRFSPDARFLADLRAKLTAKFGRPTSSTAETFTWELIENVSRADGSRLPFKTNWASAYLSGGEEGVSLEIAMLDFRVQWTDDAKVNAAPRDRASERLRF